VFFVGRLFSTKGGQVFQRGLALILLHENYSLPPRPIIAYGGFKYFYPSEPGIDQFLDFVE